MIKNFKFILKVLNNLSIYIFFLNDIDKWTQGNYEIISCLPENVKKNIVLVSSNIIEAAEIYERFFFSLTNCHQVSSKQCQYELIKDLLFMTNFFAMRKKMKII